MTYDKRQAAAAAREAGLPTVSPGMRKADRAWARSRRSTRAATGPSRRGRGMTAGRRPMRTRSRTRWTWRCWSGSTSTGARSGAPPISAAGPGAPGLGSPARGVGEIDGVDLSPGMLEAARARGVYARCARARSATPASSRGAYDLVVSCLVDEHLADLRPLYAEAARLARPGGRFVLVGFHPHFIIASGHADPLRRRRVGRVAGDRDARPPAERPRRRGPRRRAHPRRAPRAGRSTTSGSR